MSATPRGFLILVLHAHMPFIHHDKGADLKDPPTLAGGMPSVSRFARNSFPIPPRLDRRSSLGGGLEECWLFESITETFIPLIERLQGIADDNLRVRLTMSFSPTLLAMMDNDLLKDNYVRYLEKLVELSEREIQRTRWQPMLNRLAIFYHRRFTGARKLYVEKWRRSVIGQIRQLVGRGYIEPIASAATHGFLPALQTQHRAVRAQVRVGIQAFEAAFGRRPKGFWLPECGYHPGLDDILGAEGIEYIFTDAHAVVFGAPRPKYGVFAPVVCPSGVYVFARDIVTAKRLWSKQDGYPSDPRYREFHRDIGYDLRYKYLRPYLGGDGNRIGAGIKYYRLTGKTKDKQPYDPDAALQRSAEHAGHFVRECRSRMRRLSEIMDRAPLIVSPFDAEIFGSWWFEGPDWLGRVMREVHDNKDMECATASEYLGRYPDNQPVRPILSSWGAGGFGDTWINGSNDWIYPHLHRMAERMTIQANTHLGTDGLRARALNQLARELLLAQASDWPFMLKTQAHMTYAYRRMHEHLERFNHLDQALQRNEIDPSRLAEVEAIDSIFPFLDYRMYATTRDT